VTAWDVTWEKGKSTGMVESRFDQISITLSEGAVKTTLPDKTWAVEHARFGSVRFESKGVVAAKEGVSEKPRREMIVEFKSYAAPTLQASVAQELKANGMPGQFDSPDSVKLFENDRVIVWDKTWVPGHRQVHVHYEQIVGVIIQNGSIRTLSAQGEVQGDGRNMLTVGNLTFARPRSEPHQDELAQGALRMIFLQFR
jgi:hypothetical protein